MTPERTSEALLGDAAVQRLEAFIGEACGGAAAKVLSARRLDGGAVQENHALDVRVRDRDGSRVEALVMRTDAASRLSASLTRGEEFLVLQAAHAAGACVPEPLWLCEDEAVIGRPFFVMRRVSGVAAGHRLVRDPEVLRQGDTLAEELGHALAQVHMIRPPFPGLEFLQEPDLAPAQMRVYSYRAYLDELPDPHPAVEWGLRWLQRHAPRHRETVLCHGDFRIGNLMIENGRLTGILDWEFAAWGDPHEDLGWFCARCWRFGNRDREAGGVGSREAFRRGYEQASGTEVDPEALAYWEIMAALRWAVIALLQAGRETAGGRARLELALTGRMVPEMELDVLEQIEALSAGR